MNEEKRFSVSPKIIIFFTILSVIAAPIVLFAELKPADIFSDNMVLQRGTTIPVWGTADNGTTINVSLDGQNISTVTTGGKWLVYLAPVSSSGPYTMTVNDGTTTLNFQNVLAGDVWLAGGQSNMQVPLSYDLDGEKAVSESTNTHIRLFIVPRISTPGASCDKPYWYSCSPAIAQWFSAIGYYFAKELEKNVGVPIGVIECDWGATVAGTWMSQSVLESTPAFIPIITKLQQLYGTNNNSNSPHALYDAMLKTVQPYALKGFIWYQGESDSILGFSELYKITLPALIQNWRQDWGLGNIPFLIAQLSSFESIDFSVVRDMQLNTWKIVPNTAMAVTVDVGDRTNIHPLDKKTVGERLALGARAVAYNESIVYSGPIYKSMVINSGKITLSFDHIGSGLMAKDGALKEFVISGEDNWFYEANAEIKNDTVVVWNDKVTEPKAVRYGWGAYCIGNLYNKEGLPASPFRTDNSNFVQILSGPLKDFNPAKNKLMQEWNFVEDGLNWKVGIDCTIKSENGKLIIDSTGADPSILPDAMKQVKGPLVFMVKIKADSLISPLTQLFWMTDKNTFFDETHSKLFSLYNDNQWHEYIVLLNDENIFTNSRFDPCMSPGHVEVEWFRLYSLTEMNTVQTQIINPDVNEEITITTPAGWVKVEIPAGTFTETVNAEVTVVTEANIPAIPAEQQKLNSQTQQFSPINL